MDWVEVAPNVLMAIHQQESGSLIYAFRHTSKVVGYLIPSDDINEPPNIHEAVEYITHIIAPGKEDRAAKTTLNMDDKYFCTLRFSYDTWVSLLEAIISQPVSVAMEMIRDTVRDFFAVYDEDMHPAYGSSDTVASWFGYDRGVYESPLVYEHDIVPGRYRSSGEKLLIKFKPREWADVFLSVRMGYLTLEKRVLRLQLDDPLAYFFTNEQLAALHEAPFEEAVVMMSDMLVYHREVYEFGDEPTKMLSAMYGRDLTFGDIASLCRWISPEMEFSTEFLETAMVTEIVRLAILDEIKQYNERGSV